MQDKKSGCSLFGIVALVVVVGAMIIFSDFLKWILIGFGVLVAGLVTALIVLSRKEKKKKKQIVAEGTTLGDVERIIKEGEARLQALRRNFYKLKDTKMQNELDLISNLFRQMFKIVKEDPKDIKAARRYINATFSSLETIIGQSVALFEAPNLSDEAKQTLENAAEGMVMIRKATEKQINKFYENNVLDLDVELTVLKKSLSSRGLLEEEQKEETNISE